MGNMKNFLANAKKNWGQTIADSQQGAFENYPDGEYIAQISGLELTESKSKGLKQIVRSFTILEGELEGKTHKDYVQLEGKLGLQPLAWFMSSLGVKLEDMDLETLEEDLEEIVGENLVVRISLKTKGDFQNTRILKILPEYEPESFASTAPVVEHDVAADEQAPVMDESSEGGEEGEDIKVGMKVSFKLNGKDSEGIVKEIDEINEVASIKVGLKTHEIKFADLGEIVDEELDA